MKRLQLASLVLVIVLLLTSLVHSASVNSYWTRMERGFPNSVEVYGYEYEYRSPQLEISAHIPQLAGALDATWQAEFNQNLKNHLATYIAEMQEIAQIAEPLAPDAPTYVYQVIVDYEVKLNHGGLLSIALLTYSYTGGAHGMTFLEYLNFDLTTGLALEFSDLFTSEAELERAAELISTAISVEPELYFIDNFGPELFGINQGFYLQDKQVVVCFGLYEIAPYVAGIQEFAVPAP